MPSSRIRIRTVGQDGGVGDSTLTPRAPDACQAAPIHIPEPFRRSSSTLSPGRYRESRQMTGGERRPLIRSGRASAAARRHGRDHATAVFANNSRGTRSPLARAPPSRRPPLALTTEKAAPMVSGSYVHFALHRSAPSQSFRALSASTGTHAKFHHGFICMSFFTAPIPAGPAGHVASTLGPTRNVHPAIARFDLDGSGAGRSQSIVPVSYLPVSLLPCIICRIFPKLTPLSRTSPALVS